MHPSLLFDARLVLNKPTGHSLNHPEVIQYSMYVNAGQKKTVASEFRRRYRYWRSALRRRLSLPRQRNEFRYNAYTVLCTHQGGALQIF